MKRYRLVVAIVATTALAVVPTAAPNAFADGRRTHATTRLARPAADDPAVRGTYAPVAGVVPGLTGAAARAAAGLAADHFRQIADLRARSAGAVTPAAAQLHTTWGILMPINGSQGLHATQSVLGSGTTTTTGGDYVYAPTALPAGSACIELTTAYTPSGPDLWAWDWCGGRDQVGKLTPMDANFLATYTTTVNGRPAYSMDEHKTSTTANTWTVYLYNYVTHAWDSYFTSTGVYDLPQYAFGWNMFEIYTSVNPSTGAGYYCHDFAGRSFDSSSVQVSVGGVWTAASTANSNPTDTSTPSGSAFDCPALSFAVVHANDHWTAQIAGGSTPPTGVSYEAEATGNTLGGQAAVRASSGASGGAVVGYVGNGTANILRFNKVTVTAAGSHQLTIFYASGAARSVSASVNGAAAVTVATPSTGGWDTVGSVSMSVTLAAGVNTIQLGNATGWAPDIDRVVVT